MRKFLSTCMLFVMPLFIWAQNYSYKSEIIEVPNKTADEIYLKAKEWFALSFNSAKDVIQMDERPTTIIGKGTVSVNFPTEVMKKTFFIPMLVNFTFSSKFKDGRCKYDLIITDVNSSNSGYPTQLFLNYVNGSTIEGAKANFEKTNMQGVKITDKMLINATTSCKCFCDSTYAKMDSLIQDFKTTIVSESTENNW
mgnify:CR=1 FL=1